MLAITNQGKVNKFKSISNNSKDINHFAIFSGILIIKLIILGKQNPAHSVTFRYFHAPTTDDINSKSISQAKMTYKCKNCFTYSVQNYPQYWPAEGSAQYGSIILQKISENTSKNITTRMFSVSNAEVRLLAWETRPGVSGDYSNKASSPSRFKISIEWRKGFEMDGENTKFKINI